jgi:hypothetical protein
MLGLRRSDGTSVYVVADHLDGVLAAGEDILRLRLDLAAQPTGQPPGEALRRFVESVRSLEMILVAHALQARTRAKELVDADAPLRRLLALFAGGTAVLEDAVEELGDATLSDFDTADDPLAYLRSRGLLAADAGSLRCVERLVIGEDFLVVQRICLGVLMDLAASFLDALEDCYDLAVEDEDDIAQQIAAVKRAVESQAASP